MPSDLDRAAFVKGRIESVLDAMSSLMATIHRLDRSGFDTTDAKDRLTRLEAELEAWRETQRAIAER